MPSNEAEGHTVLKKMLVKVFFFYLFIFYLFMSKQLHVVSSFKFDKHACQITVID